MTWTEWKTVKGRGLRFKEIAYEKKRHRELEGGIARIAFSRPEKYNAMTTRTVDEMFRAFYDAGHDPMVGGIVLTGVGDNFGAGGDIEW